MHISAVAFEAFFAPDMPRCSAIVHAQPARRGHELGPFNRPEKTSESAHLGGGEGLSEKRTRPPVDKAKSAARSLPECARRAKRVMKNISVLREKVGRSVPSSTGGLNVCT